jgi:predicted alpha-1,6-mannanase (GH76 family)
MPPLPSLATLKAHAADAIGALQQWYVPSLGLYHWADPTFPASVIEAWGDMERWWNSANAITAVIDYTSITSDQSYVTILPNTFVNAQNAGFSFIFSIVGYNTNFLNGYYDDEGWWALAWIRAYDLTQDNTYLFMAIEIFFDMTGGWDLTCGGGIWWDKGHTYKNAIANELFLAVASALCVRIAGPYKSWVEQEWIWFRDSGLINAQNLINDGLNSYPSCDNNGGTTWTYNQGVILGALCDAYLVLGDPSCLATARKIADAAIENLVDSNGILTEPCEGTSAGCNMDQAQFKGIFMRNLARLFETTGSVKYGQFILRNAAAVWEFDCNLFAQFGLSWSGPIDTVDFVRQSSALDALNAAMRVRQHPATISYLGPLLLGGHRAPPDVSSALLLDSRRRRGSAPYLDL